MLWTIVRREITANILSFRFLMGLLIYFSLIVTNLFVLTRGYENSIISCRVLLARFLNTHSTKRVARSDRTARYN